MIETGNLVLEINQCWNDVDAVFSGHAVVVDLDETDGFRVAYFIDLLELEENFLRFLVIVVICHANAT